MFVTNKIVLFDRCKELIWVNFLHRDIHYAESMSPFMKKLSFTFNHEISIERNTQEEIHSWIFAITRVKTT